jgi:hypothetical protein
MAHLNTHRKPNLIHGTAEKTEYTESCRTIRLVDQDMPMLFGESAQKYGYQSDLPEVINRQNIELPRQARGRSIFSTSTVAPIGKENP